MKKKIKSSNLKSAEYDAETEVLIVEFKNETRYQYPDVAAPLYADFEKTFDGEDGRSAGKYFHKHIRPLPCDKIEE